MVSLTEPLRLFALMRAPCASATAASIPLIWDTEVALPTSKWRTLRWKMIGTAGACVSSGCCCCCAIFRPAVLLTRSSSVPEGTVVKGAALYGEAAEGTAAKPGRVGIEQAV